MTGFEAHLKEENLREKGEFLEALKYSDEATLLYQEEGNIVSFCEVQAARFEIFKHLYQKTGERNYLILGKFAAKSAVKIAEKSTQPAALAIPLYCLAKALTLLGKHDKAQEKYQEALDALPASHQNRPSVEADIKIHKAICAFQMGDKNAIEEAEKTVEELSIMDEQKYEKDVWVSGGYLKIAEAINPTDHTKAREYLDKAELIINSNPELILRKEQLEKIQKEIGN